jgi:hypothetical protein
LRGSWRSRTAVLAPSWGSLGVLLRHSWGPLGALWGGLGALLGLFGEIWKASWDRLGQHGSKREGVDTQAPPRRLKQGVLGPSLGVIRALLGALGAVLGPSWAPLGALLGRLGAILRPREPIGSEKARRQQTIDFLYVFSPNSGVNLRSVYAQCVCVVYLRRALA